MDPTPSRKEKARSLAERALALQPDCPEGHLARGFSYYYGERDYENALKEFAIAQRGLPNDAEVYLAIGAIQRRQGKWNESNSNLEKAVSLNPNDTWPLQNLALNYEVQKNFDAANRTVDRALKLDPDSLGLWSIKAQMAIAANGNLEVAKQVVANLKPEHAKGYLAGSAVQILFLQRKFAEGLRAAEQINDDVLAKDPEALPMKYTVIGIGKKVLGDEAGAREAFLTAKRFAEKYVSDAPNEAARHSKLAAVLAWLGEKEAAIAEGIRATELLPENVDAFDGPKMTEALAEVYCIVGEQDKAIVLLDHLLSRPSFVTVASLKVMPMWDWLRQNPRFAELLKKHGG
jgi:tetratricopeptide (TPR) repeat protein